MRLQATRTSVTSTGGAGDALYRAAGGRPTLDQRFAKDKSLVDKVSGQNLITFTRASSATYVGSDGLIKTAATDEARFDHDPTTGESLGLLIEEARTNLLANSSGDLNSSYWSTASMPSVSTVDGPGGANTAIQYLSAGGTVVSKLQTVTNNYPTTVIGTQYVLSCYVKGVNYDIVTFGGSAGGFIGNTRCSFDLSDGTLVNQTAATESARAIPAGNGWYRLEVVTIAATAAASFALFLDLGTSFADPHTTSEGFQVYGFQVEEGTFVSSYIPTTNAQATRATELAKIEGTNFSSFYNQSSGTFVTTSSAVTNLQSGDARGIFFVDDTGTSGNTFRHYLLYRGVNLDNFFIPSRFNNVNAFSPANTGNPTYSNDTIAYGYSSSEISKVFHDGSLITSSTSVLDWTTYTANFLNIGGFVKLNGHISRFTYFPTKRTDQELINVSGGNTAIPIITYGITSTGGDFTLRSDGTVNYAVDWDSSGGYQESTSNALVNTYTAGNYDLVVYSDDVYRPYFNNVTADVDQITSVVINPGANLGDNLVRGWEGGDNITSFECPFEVTSNVTNLNNAWRFLNSLTSFPLIDTSSCTSFSNTWSACSSLTSFPLIQTSSGESFANCWLNLNSLVSFPQLNFSSGTRFRSAWRGCTTLLNFPANVFDTTGTLSTDAFDIAWLNCALTVQSIENILVSLDTNGQSNILLGIDGGTNAAKTTWSAAAVTAYDNLIVKGWTIAFNA